MTARRLPSIAKESPATIASIQSHMVCLVPMSKNESKIARFGGEQAHAGGVVLIGETHLLHDPERYAKNLRPVVAHAPLHSTVVQAHVLHSMLEVLPGVSHEYAQNRRWCRLLT